MEWRRTLLVAAAMTVAAPLTSPATAHPWTSGEQPFYYSSTYCGTATATISHGVHDYGRSAGDVYSYVNQGDESCARLAGRGPAQLAQRLFIYHRGPTATRHGLCAYTQWYYNGNQVAHFQIYVDALSGICGEGYYSMAVHGAIGVNGVWQSAAVWLHEWHYFKAPPTPSPSAPAGVR